MTVATLKNAYRIPAVLSIITIAGLLSALLGDGSWDELSWGLLTMPIFASSFFLCRSSRKN